MPALIAAGSVGQASIRNRRSASLGLASTFSASLVQALVQATSGGGATVVTFSLAIDAHLPVTLEAEGSSPFTLALLVTSYERSAAGISAFRLSNCPRYGERWVIRSNFQRQLFSNRIRTDKLYECTLTLSPHSTTFCPTPFANWTILKRPFRASPRIEN